MVLAIFYFSWINSPRLRLSGLLPEFVTSWTDTTENETLRTGVPFLFLSILVGVKLVLNKSDIRYWVLSFLGLTAIVCIAELGQLFLPLRISDLKDVFWGSAGSFFGLVCVYLILRVFQFIKQKS